MNKTQKIILACLNSVLDGASDFDDQAMVFEKNRIKKWQVDDSYYRRYDGKWTICANPGDQDILKASMDSVIEGACDWKLDDFVCQFQGKSYSLIEVMRAYRRLGYHRID